jgi:hypothetical protein
MIQTLTNRDQKESIDRIHSTKDRFWIHTFNAHAPLCAFYGLLSSAILPCYWDESGLVQLEMRKV